MSLRVGFDATPLVPPLTGIGTYTDRLVRALASERPDLQLVAAAFTWHGRELVAGQLPPGVEAAPRTAPARLLRALWGEGDRPAVERLTGPLDVFHATNFVLPPTRPAATVLTVHDLAYLRFPETVSAASRAYQWLVPRGIDRADVVLTPSRAVADQLTDAYPGALEKVRVTPLGVDPEWFGAAPPSPAWLEARGIRGPYLLAVGTLEPRKNLTSLVRGYARLLATRAAPPQLVLVGGPGWGPALATADVPADRVVLPGYLPAADLRQVVAGAGALVFPSVDEGFGLPPLEALACGVPVVVNDLPVLREVLGDAARFVDADDADALAVALGETLDGVDVDAERGRRRARGFTWARCAALTEEAYREAVRRRGG